MLKDSLLCVGKKSDNQFACIQLKTTIGHRKLTDTLQTTVNAN